MYSLTGKSTGETEPALSPSSQVPGARAEQFPALWADRPLFMSYSEGLLGDLPLCSPPPAAEGGRGGGRGEREELMVLEAGAFLKAQALEGLHPAHIKAKLRPPAGRTTDGHKGDLSSKEGRGLRLSRPLLPHPPPAPKPTLPRIFHLSSECWPQTEPVGWVKGHLTNGHKPKRKAGNLRKGEAWGKGEDGHKHFRVPGLGAGNPTWVAQPLPWLERESLRVQDPK